MREMGWGGGKAVCQVSSGGWLKDERLPIALLATAAHAVCGRANRQVRCHALDDRHPHFAGFHLRMLPAG